MQTAEGIFAMQTEDDFFREVIAENRVRPSVRCIVLNHRRDSILVQRNPTSREPHVAFPGGRVEIGETFVECLAREFQEETGAAVTQADYLFVVENMFDYMGNLVHSLEHYFAVRLERDRLDMREPHVINEWLPLAQLADADLRPVVVRDAILDNSYRSIRHLISRP